MEMFIVYLYNKKNETEEMTVCNSMEDLATFLQHIDKDVYAILGDIHHATGEFNPDYKAFCRHIKDLELGKGEQTNVDK